MKSFSKPVRRKIRGAPSRNFYSRVRDAATGRRRWMNLNVTSLKAAAERIKVLELADARGEKPQRDMLLHEAIDGWLSLKKGTMTQRGLEGYGCHVKAWKAFFSSTANVRDVEPRDVERYFLHRGREVSNMTLNKERVTLRAFFRWTAQHGLKDDMDPLRTTPRFKEQRRAIRALSPEEQARLLKACAERYSVTVVARRNAGGREGKKRTEKESTWEQNHAPPPWVAPVVRIALASGLRLGNIETLAWNDVDFARREIRIAPQRMKARREFVLPLDQATVDFLAQLKGSATSTRVFPGIDRRALQRSFERAAERAGLAPLRFHDLRATFISTLRRSGVDVEIAARLAGHADVTTTLRFYREIREEELRGAMERRASATAAGGKPEAAT
jgi:integrase